MGALGLVGIGGDRCSCSSRSISRARAREFLLGGLGLGLAGTGGAALIGGGGGTPLPEGLDAGRDCVRGRVVWGLLRGFWGGAPLPLPVFSCGAEPEGVDWLADPFLCCRCDI